MILLRLEVWLLAGILLTGMALSVRLRKLTLTGALTGGLLALFIYLGSGFTGIGIMAAFFIMGTLATGHRIEVKEALKAAEKSKGKRNAMQVLSNAGLPAICGLLAWIFPEQAYPFQLMMAAAFSSATADTLSSELGTLYGKKFYNIATFRKDRKGLDGVVSLEGTLIGLLGSIVIAVLFALGFDWSLGPLWILVAGTVGNLADSLLGATLQRRHYLSNNGVNLFNTILAALTALFFYLIE
jgi:uncharacterized protein (TIGR00297 family)